MTIKWIGMLLILGSSVSVGLGAAMRVRRCCAQLSQLQSALELMKCELSYTMTKLPQLAQVVADATQGAVSALFSRLAVLLKQESEASCGALMAQAIAQTKGLALPDELLAGLRELGQTLGRYDLDGQLRLLDLLLARIGQLAGSMETDRRARCRSYEALGICTGLAIIILMM